MQLKMARAPLLAYSGHAGAASLARYARVSPEPSAAGRHSATRHGAGRLWKRSEESTVGGIAAQMAASRAPLRQ
jgi:hypothetical protein